MTLNEHHAMGANDAALTRLWSTLRVIGWIAVPVLLLIPMAAMRFTDEVQWTTMDFAFAGGILISAGLVLELVTWSTRNPAIRFGAALAAGLAVGLIWAWAVA
ncbi:MAG: hypothetical protein M3Q74_13895 [Pseudomonadota bacterium]|nr:hypothetical protein [Pseudomonadota bacterium]